MPPRDFHDVSGPLGQLELIIPGVALETAKSSTPFLPAADPFSLRYSLSTVRTNVAFPEVKEIFFF